MVLDRRLFMQSSPARLEASTRCVAAYSAGQSHPSCLQSILQQSGQAVLPTGLVCPLRLP